MIGVATSPPITATTNDRRSPSFPCAVPQIATTTTTDRAIETAVDTLPESPSSAAGEYPVHASTCARTLRRCGYEPTPTNPIAAQLRSSVAAPTAAKTPNARRRRVASSQTPSGQRNILTTVASAAEVPATDARC